MCKVAGVRSLHKVQPNTLSTTLECAIQVIAQFQIVMHSEM